MGLTVSLDDGRDACAESIRAFVRAVDGLSEHELLGGSRCHGWTRLDVVVHVIAGWQEMLGGLVSVVASQPSVDAASYWTAFAAEFGGEDPVTTLMAQRRRTAAYARPASATTHLHDVAEALLRGVEEIQDRPRLWQGQVFTAGDYLAVWAVEDVVHHLDLLSAEPAPENALTLTRATVEALVGERFPATVDDEEAVLVGTGRLPVPPSLVRLSSRLPALS